MSVCTIVSASADGGGRIPFCINKSEGYWMCHPNRDCGSEVLVDDSYVGDRSRL